MNIRDLKPRIRARLSGPRHARRSGPSQRVIAVIGVSALIPLMGAVGAHADTQPINQPYTVTMSASANPVAPGSSLTYTITTINSEPQVANVRLSDQVNGLSNLVLTSSRGYCTDSSHLVSCQAGDMPGAGSSWTVTITGTVVGGSGTALSNTATVNADWSSQNTSHNFTVNASANVQVSSPANGQLADLATSFSGPSTVASGGAAVYTLTVSNFGFVKASDILVSATLPVGWGLQNLQSVVGTSLFNCTTALPDITCTGGALNAGANATITIPALAASAPNTYKMTAAVDPENAIAEPDDLQSNANNYSQFSVAVPAGPLPTEPITFTKSASSIATPGDGTQIRPGDMLTYTITAKNTSAKYTSTRVQISDGTQGLDQAFVKAVASDPKLPCTNSNNLVTCMAGGNGYTLATGGTVTVTITGRVVQPAATIIRNTATLQTLQNKVSITRNASVTTIVRPPVDLTVTQFSTCSSVALLTPASRGDCLPFRARDQFDYLVTVGNSGLDDAKNVVVREVLPPDVIYEGFQGMGSGFSCSELPPANANPTTVTCTLAPAAAIPGALATPVSYGGNTRQFRLNLTAPNTVGTISSTVYIDPYNQIPENDETNNTFTTTTAVATGVDLTIAQTVRCVPDSRSLPTMCDPAAPSGTIIYNIMVQNVGTQDASGIKVSDVLPTGARFRSAKEIGTPAYTFGVRYSPVHNVSCSATSGRVDCTGGRIKGIYAAFGGPKLELGGTVDGFVIEVMAFAPAPYGPNSSPNATGSPILNQVTVDPQNTIPEFIDSNSTITNNLNILETDVMIPPPGDYGTFNELTVTNTQVSPGVDGSGNALPVAPNGTLDYDLTVRNFGSDPASNIVVSDVFPTGARFRDVTADPLAGNTGGFGCTYNNGVLTCANGALAQAPGPVIGSSSATVIHIRLFAPPVLSDSTTRYTNHAVVDPSNTIPEADETNNISDAALTVKLPDAGGLNAYNELSILNEQTNPASGTDVAPNGTLEYTLTAKNTGSDIAQNVTVYDYVPQGSRFRNVTVSPYGGAGTSGGFLCSFNTGLVTCNSGTLAGGGSATIKILLFAPETPSSNTQHYTNHAVIDPNNAIPEADENNNATDTPLTVSIGGANPFNELDVSMEQSFPAPGTDVAPGGTLRYLLKVHNTGSDTAFQVPVRDYLPEGTSYRKAHLLGASDGTTGATGFICTRGSGVVDCTNGTLQSGGVAVIEVLLFAPTQPSNPGSETMITNQAVVDPNNNIAEADETNNTSTQDTGVKNGGASGFWDLSVADNSSPTTGTPDDQLTWSFTVTNNGSDDLFNATVSDTLPAGFVFVAAGDTDPANPERFTCAQNSGVVTCTGGTVRAGGTRTINVAVNAPHKNVSTVNTVQADPNNTVVEADETNNALRLNMVIASVIDLTISLDSASIGQGNPGHIKGHITNTGVSGSEDAHNVLSVWNLPVGVTMEDTNAPAGTSCSTATDDTVNQVTCVTLTLSPGAPVDFDFYVFQNNDQAGNDNAAINGDHATVESDETNNAAQSTVS
jgi:uncharacterized repeat protein (TIGR01451 family)/fimbrial isopeptide formation D2 family protein